MTGCFSEMLGIAVGWYVETDAINDDELRGLPGHVAGDPGDGGQGGWKQYWERNQSKMNNGQAEAFKTITDAIKQSVANQRELKLFFLEGAGGTGIHT